MNKFSQRLIATSISIIVLFFCVYYSNLPWMKPIVTSFLAGIVGFAMREYYKLAKTLGYQPQSIQGIATGTAYIFLISYASPIITAFITCVLCFFILSYFLFDGKDPLVNSAITLFGLIYLAIPLGSALFINNFFPDFQGRYWLLYALSVTKITDMGGYLIGKSFGSHLLAPQVSPKKTIEGLIGGICFALITSIFLPPLLHLNIPPMVRIIFGLLIGLLAQGGDLIESLFKRNANVKDSSRLPGLGGVLDVVDSLIFTLPIVYFYLLTYGEQYL